MSNENDFAIRDADILAGQMVLCGLIRHLVLRGIIDGQTVEAIFKGVDEAAEASLIRLGNAGNVHYSEQLLKSIEQLRVLCVQDHPGAR